MKIDLSGRVAIVTGAGGGLGREHALLLASRGAKVVVNDVGSGRDGIGNSAAADAVCEAVRAAGGEAIASAASVTDAAQVQRMVDDVAERWGGVDILVNNAGILRDRTFANLSLEDFRAVVDVHLWGSVYCTRAVWPLMKSQAYGRIVLTSSSSGLYGNFGQSAYGTAKMAVVGLMNTLRLEGAKYDIHVNCLAPSAATRMTDDVLDEAQLRMMSPAEVSPAVLALVAEKAPTGMIMCAGSGSFELAHITLTRGLFLGGREDVAEQILRRFEEIGDRSEEMVPASGPEQSIYEVAALRSAMQS